MTYLNNLCQLDARRLMTSVAKVQRRLDYTATVVITGEEPVIFSIERVQDRQAVISLCIDWPKQPDQPVIGSGLVKFEGWDGRRVKQMLQIVGMPAKVAGPLWRFTCPVTGKLVQTLYLSPADDRFVSRFATDLKFCPAVRGPAARHTRACERLRKKLKSNHYGPGIFKPAGMRDKTFDRLSAELRNADVRRLCALAKRPKPNLDDDDDDCS